MEARKRKALSTNSPFGGGWGEVVGLNPCYPHFTTTLLFLEKSLKIGKTRVFVVTGSI
jgi:hypothetical protein